MNVAKLQEVIIYDYFYERILWTFHPVKAREKDDETYLKKLGKRIATIRKEQGITQVGLAYSCDIEKQNMRRIEAGNTNPTVLMLKRISVNLGMSVSELLDF